MPSGPAHLSRRFSGGGRELFPLTAGPASWDGASGPLTEQAGDQVASLRGAQPGGHVVAAGGPVTGLVQPPAEAARVLGTAAGPGQVVVVPGGDVGEGPRITARDPVQARGPQPQRVAGRLPVGQGGQRRPERGGQAGAAGGQPAPALERPGRAV